VNYLPLNHEHDILQVEVDGTSSPSSRADELPKAEIVAVSWRYFQVLGGRLTGGRAFTDIDGATAPPVAIINESMRRHYFPTGVAIGKSVRVLEREGGRTTVTIVGVVANMRQASLAGPAEPVLYRPMAQRTDRYFRLLLRGDGDTLALIPAARRAVRAADPYLAAAEIRSLTAVVDQAMLPERAMSAVLLVLGMGAMLLSAFGIYGVMSYIVARRGREIGIRVALGATRSDVLDLVLRRGVVLTGTGFVAGGLGGFALSRLLSGFLGAGSGADAAAFGAAGVGLAAIALLACVLPARRALRVDPAIALRD
jgi:putative ABC transport system permease protein